LITFFRAKKEQKQIFLVRTGEECAFRRSEKGGNILLQSHSINLVVKAKATNQWMEGAECRLQIEVKFSQDRECVHCHKPQSLRKFPSILANPTYRDCQNIVLAIGPLVLTLALARSRGYCEDEKPPRGTPLGGLSNEVQMFKSAIPVLHVSSAAAAEEFYCNRLSLRRVFAYRFDEAQPEPCSLLGATLHLQRKLLQEKPCVGSLSAPAPPEKASQPVANDQS
jgi:hypothetical protein